MKHPLHFTKASGAGNDFVIINNIDGALRLDQSKLAIALCSRHFGIGADGLLVLESSRRVDFFMRYYNADGSYGGMCGNGGRCAARFAFLQKIAGPSMKFEALDYVYEAKVGDNAVTLKMKDASILRPDIKIQVHGHSFTGDFVETGSPHLVIFHEKVEELNVHDLGRELAHASVFAPEGSNVNFVNVSAPQRLVNRTYERGVEAETLACGTGAIASAIVSSVRSGFLSPVRLNVRSGEELLVHFKRDGARFTDISLEGSAYILFSGTLLFDSSTSLISTT
jgi:diaminopimelate epimerase